MAKNLRSALSIVSAAGLVGAALVAAPAAMAAGEIKFEANAGTQYAVPHNADFTLKATMTAGYATSELDLLKYKVETDGTFEVNAIVSAVGTGADTSSAVLVDDEETSDTIDGGLSATSTVGTISVWADAAGNTAFAQNASSVSAVVTAWIDKDSDDVVDSDEWSASRTITWVDSDLLSVTHTMDQPALAGSGAILKSYLTSTQINLAQSSADFTVDFTGAGSVSDLANLPAYSAVTDKSTYSSAGVAVVAGDYVSTLKVQSTTIRTITRSVSATTVATVDGAALAGADNAAIANNGSAANIRSGSGTMTYTVTVQDSTPAGIAGKTVNLNVSESAANNIESAARITANGVTLSNASVSLVEDIDATAVTDADGEATFTISWTGLGAVTAGDPFVITASVDGNAEAAVTLTTVDAAATTMYSANVAATDENVVVAVATPFTLTYHLVDQFGALFTAAGYSVTATNSTDSVVAASNFVNGAATVSFAGVSALNKGSKTVTSAVAAVGSSPSITGTQVTVFVGAPEAPASITLAGTYGTAASKTALNTKATASADVRFGTATTSPDNEITDVSATVRDANGNGTRSQVTFSGANLTFKSATGIYSKGSITVWTDSSGVADVDVSSQVGGTQVMTVTAGGASATKSIVFAGAGATVGTTWTITMPASVAAGSTFKVVGTLTDKFGNPVAVSDTADISVTYDGPGLVSGTLPNTTNALGQFSFWVLAGSSDSGTGTVTASYDQGSDGDFTGAVTGDMDVVATKTILIGEAAVTKKVNAGSFKGYVAVYARGYEGQRLSAKIGKDWIIVPSIVNNQESGTLFRVTDFTGAGVDIAVRIYIDRVLIDTINLTTK